ncbi:S-layer domain-containing protein [Gottschalkia acidurici 9a]|uniref:S-layer domain-containing protein n=1 Tax=Gottschalkia acidurici (strain ATCC 7906 / DSM 604 / BCRC 14475 / CIP 104303 / KCTC 5404 / NCIMB 10678 / 9a) TaxID=1128398 RepID=K0ATS0_GOTA9|nr:S-layer homology domain-containing protein [Gottschalkia acidurici]AFS77248.1 S-layer domain-containing protein [Gottschalkia acidurici 9a]
MKKFIAALMTTILLISPLSAFAEFGNAGFEGGIHKNERDSKKTKEYKELLLITGKPVMLEGTIEPKYSDKKVTYKYTLANKDKTVQLKRNLEFDREINFSNNQKQIVEVNNITKYTETITDQSEGERTTYTLTDYQLHNSTVDDNQPVVTFYQGNWEGTKTYAINRDEGEIEVSISGTTYGYDHFWGGTETQKIHQDINYSRKTEDDKTMTWYGNSDIDVSFNRTKDMTYFSNIPNQSSFDGVYTLTEQDQTIMKYSYSLPIIDRNGKIKEQKNIGHGTERYDTVPTQKKLFIPQYKDIKGHWAEWDIKKLGGLEVLDDKTYFGPNLSIKRSEFAKWIAKSMDLIQEEDSSSRTSRRKKEEKVDLFSDVTKVYPDYDYIKVITEKEIMNGIGENRFSPDGSLTRAEAITIVIRSLGLERLAPNGYFQTRFRDDGSIPVWAKRSVYVADQVGISKGTPEGYIYPNEVMTKAEAATFINRLINYLQQDLKVNYREHIIN